MPTTSHAEQILEVLERDPSAAAAVNSSTLREILADDRGCPGHPNDGTGPIGETMYCDGSCDNVAHAIRLELHRRGEAIGD